MAWRLVVNAITFFAHNKNRQYEYHFSLLNSEYINLVGPCMLLLLCKKTKKQKQKEKQKKILICHISRSYIPMFATKQLL